MSISLRTVNSTSTLWACELRHAISNDTHVRGRAMSDDVTQPSEGGTLPNVAERTVRVDGRRHGSSTLKLASVGAAGTLAGIALMLFVSRGTSPQASTPVQTRPAAATLPAATRPPVTVDSEPAPAWVGRRHATWARDGSKTISFELQAMNDVPVWMTEVRPVLVVRCLFRSTEVFVATGSAATIEPRAGLHTVRLQIDNDAEQLQQWSDSESSQELFALDGPLLVRRLARAHRVRFGFNPYNAKPVVADFVVDGFDKLAGLVASTCGWRLDG